MSGFTEVIKTQMENKGISKTQLCEGLCSQSMFVKICNGERGADKLLRERLLQRLGVSDTRNESSLYRDEYDAWRLRQQIVNHINREQYKLAEGLLEEYKSKAAMENKLEQQFGLVMEVQLWMAQGRGEEQIQERVERALKLTVPHIDTKPLHQLVLSEHEMDLVLEYARYCHPERMAECCRALLEYVKQHISDEYLQAKIFPKIVYYQCIAEREGPDRKMLLRNCNEAIACLRDTQRLYYFWELLGEREKIYEHFIKKDSAEGENTHKQVFVRMQEENALWKRTLEEMGNTVTVERVELGGDADLTHADFVYMGAGTERAQKAALLYFSKLGDAVKAAADAGVTMLFAGNSMELLGKTITDAEGNTYDGIALAGFTATQGKKRLVEDVYGHTTLYAEPVVGFMNKCSVLSGVETPLLTDLELGYGNDGEKTAEGFHWKNVFGSHLTGPILVKNPRLLDAMVDAIYGRRGEALPTERPRSQWAEAGYAITAEQLKLRAGN